MITACFADDLSRLFLMQPRSSFGHPTRELLKM